MDMHVFNVNIGRIIPICNEKVLLPNNKIVAQWTKIFKDKIIVVKMINPDNSLSA